MSLRLGVCERVPSTMSELAQRVIEVLIARGQTLATCESLTGGSLGAELVSVPGASDAYLGGVVSYATRIKMEVAGVSPETIADYGVVSRECASQMAMGTAHVCKAAWAIATTGVAGPTEVEGHAPGTVWVAVYDGSRCQTRLLSLVGGREDVITQSVTEALRFFLECARE